MSQGETRLVLIVPVFILHQMDSLLCTQLASYIYIKLSPYVTSQTQCLPSSAYELLNIIFPLSALVSLSCTYYLVGSSQSAFCFYLSSVLLPVCLAHLHMFLSTKSFILVCFCYPQWPFSVPLKYFQDRLSIALCAVLVIFSIDLINFRF